MKSNQKTAITIKDNYIAPRFDLTPELIILNNMRNKNKTNMNLILLPKQNAEEICSFLLKENIKVLICGAIEDIYYEYLSWKKIKIIDNIIGNYHMVINLYLENKLKAGTIIK